MAPQRPSLSPMRIEDWTQLEQLSMATLSSGSFVLTSSVLRLLSFVFHPSRTEDERQRSARQWNAGMAPLRTTLKNKEAAGLTGGFFVVCSNYNLTSACGAVRACPRPRGAEDRWSAQEYRHHRRRRSSDPTRRWGYYPAQDQTRHSLVHQRLLRRL